MQPISSRLSIFLRHLDMSANRFSQALGHSGSEKISRLFRNDDSMPSVEIITDISNKFEELNIDWLLTGRGEMLKDTSRIALPTTASAIEEVIIRKGKNTGRQADIQHSKPTKGVGEYNKHTQHQPALAEHETTYSYAAPMVVTLSENNEAIMPYISIGLYTDYIKSYSKPEYISTLHGYRLPGFDKGFFRMFECEGAAMAPGILHGDKLVGEWINAEKYIPDNQVYIIVTHSEILVRRVLNHIAGQNKLLLQSDNVSRRNEFPDKEIAFSEISEIWCACLKLSSHFNSPGDIDRRVAELEADMEGMKQIALLLKEQANKKTKTD